MDKIIKKNILLIGSGGREHATVEAFLKSPNIKKLYLAPGNDAIFKGSKKVDPRLKKINHRINNQSDIKKLISEAKKLKIDFVFVGPENPLSLGVTDLFEKNNIPVIGPSKKASILESSKSWTKDLMKSLNIPIPEYNHFDNPEKAQKYVQSMPYPVVVKADGLAAGKGSIVTNNTQEAFEAIKLIMIDKKFGNAGNRVVIEKRLIGDEFSFFAFTDGKTILPLSWARDYKQVFDNNQGPNTGGMGSYSPYRENETQLTKKIMEKIALPLIKGCQKKHNFIYKGILYIGGVFVKENKQINPYVFEVNIRMGDPEAQVIYPRLKTDLVKICTYLIKGKLNQIKKLNWDKNYYLCVCATSGRVKRKGKGRYPGYPNRYSIGKKISGLNKISPEVLVFHSGTKWDNQNKTMITNGGRVLSIVASASSLKQARKKAYQEIKKITFEGIHYRNDIGKK